MRAHRRSLHWAVGTVLVASLGLAACSGGSSEGSTEPAAEQALTVAPSVFPVALDPHQWSAEGAVIGPVKHVMETLVVPDGDGGFDPLLAESWETPDDHTWVFHLDADATFSDGTPVTAEDVRASAERLVEIGGSMAPLFEPMETIEATDEQTLTITTTQPLGTVLNTMSLLFVGKADAMDDEEYWRAPIGSGPFVVESYRADEQLVFTQNAEYWRELPTLERITYQNIPEDAARITALTTGEIDVMAGVAADSVAEVEAIDGVTYEEIPGFTYQLLWFNSSREPFTDPRVRQAMWMGTDVASIVEDLFGSAATLAKAPIPQPVFGAPELEPYPYDPERARELLAEAGYPDGFETSLQWSDAGGESTRSMAQAFISDWAELGITVEPLSKERAVWLEDLNALNWDMNLQGNTVATGDADYTLGRLYLCEANRMGYCNEELDEILNAAKASLDQEEREELYAQAAQIIWEDAVGIFPMDLTVSVAYRDNVHDLELDPGNRTSYASVTLTE